MTLEFSAVRASVAQAVKQAEQARALRIESIDRQLPALESDIATKQQEVAALRAERERLQAQTGHDLVAEMLGPLEYRKVKDIPQALFDAHDGVWIDEAGDRVANMNPERRIRPRGTTFGALQAKARMAGEGGEKQDEPFLPGLPDKRLREVWAEWEQERGPVYRFEGHGYQVSTDPSRKWYSVTGPWEAGYRPHGATWEHVKRLADEAEKKESGPLKVGDRVEVPEGVRSVSGRHVDSGRYGVDRVFHDGDIGLNDGSIVRASDVRRV